MGKKRKLEKWQILLWYKLPLGNFDKGGPLFFEQYTYMGIDPNGLKDDNGIDYAEQTKNHTLINRAYCIENPKKFKGYGENCWGLTAGDSYKGYVAHCPQEDLGSDTTHSGTFFFSLYT